MQLIIMRKCLSYQYCVASNMKINSCGVIAKNNLIVIMSVGLMNRSLRINYVNVSVPKPILSYTIMF